MKRKRKRKREVAEYEARMQALDCRVNANEQPSWAESHAWSKWAGHLPEQLDKRRKRKKRRRKKLPKTSSSRMLPARAVHTWKPGHHSPHVHASVLVGRPLFLHIPGPKTLKSIWTLFCEPLAARCSVSCGAGGVQDLDSFGNDFRKMLVFLEGGYTSPSSALLFRHRIHALRQSTGLSPNFTHFPQ